MTARRIETRRLVLRMHLAGDAEWIAREIARPEVHRMLTTPPHPYTLDDARDWIERVRNDPAHLVIEQDGAPLGVVTCDPADRAETLGYWIRLSAWGQGIVTEAAGAVLTEHFAQGAEAATSGYIVDNPASARVLTKLGFVPDGMIQRHCHFRAGLVDIQLMRLTRARWDGLSRAG